MLFNKEGLGKVLIYHKSIGGINKRKEIIEKSFKDFWMALLGYERIACYCGALGRAHINYCKEFIGDYDGYIKEISVPYIQTGCVCDCHKKYFEGLD